jgi:hypothetical protein
MKTVVRAVEKVACMGRSKPGLSGLTGCFVVLSMLGDGLGKALSFGFPQNPFLWGGGGIGHWTLDITI